MKTTSFLLAVFAVAPFVCAQDGKKAPAASGAQMPDPKVPEHQALRAFVGDWQSTMKMEAVPGVPGMEKAQESTGSEHCELVCNGLWLKVTAEGTEAGKQCQGIWLLGYDPQAKAYTGLYAGSMDEASSTMTGSFDAAKKTWTFTGESPFGAFRSVLVWHDDDSSTETCYMVADGKETKCMEMVRKRATGGKTNAAPAAFTKPAAQELAVLAESVGRWDATIRISAPGAPPAEEKGTETIVPMCDGKWYWSDFKGTMMGTPFDGHSLTGYEPKTKKYVAWWIDSGTARWSRTEGEYDAAKKALVMIGKTTGVDGQPMTIEKTMTGGPDHRVQQVIMKTASMKLGMQFDYERTKN